tara:strand:+ start:236 stop:349 length:114 start_codon:yes stop_codon:yes gene_type:complete
MRSGIEYKLDEMGEEIRKIKQDILNIIKMLKKMDGYN